MVKNKKIVYGKTSIKKENVILVNEKDFSGTFWSQRKVTLDEFDHLLCLSLNKKKFLELFQYDDFSFFWFFYPYLWHEVQNSITFIIEFNKFIEEEKPSLVKISDDYGKFDLIKQICTKNKIRFRYSKSQLIKYKIRKKIGLIVRQFRLRKITKHKIQTTIDECKNKSIDVKSIHEQLVFVSADVYRRHIINSEKNTTEKGEFIFQDIMNLLPNENMCGISVSYDVRGNKTILTERLNASIPWLPLEIFIKSNNKRHSKFITQYKSLIASKNFQNMFSHIDIRYWNQVESIFKQMIFAQNLPFWLNLIDSLNSVFLVSKPKAIFLLYETGPLSLPFIIIAKRYKIKTIAVEHGVIVKNHKFYSFKSLSSNENVLGFPIPDKFLLFGESSKKILQENNYPEERLIPFGNPAFFNLDKKTEIIKRNTIRNKYEIKEDQKIILFTSIRLHKKGFGTKHEYDLDIWNYLLEKFGNNEHITIVLKPHPGEDISLYQEILDKKNHYINIRIIAEENILELIQISTIIISLYSSVIIDALCMKKPVVQIKFDDEESPIPLEKYNVVIQTKLEHLDEKINDLLSKPELTIELNKNSAEFIKFLYDIPESHPQKILDKILNN